MSQYTEENSKWQPIMMVLCGRGRLECACGALAVMAFVFDNEELTQTDYYCQSCYFHEKDMQNIIKEDNHE